MAKSEGSRPMLIAVSRCARRSRTAQADHLRRGRRWQRCRDWGEPSIARYWRHRWRLVGVGQAEGVAAQGGEPDRPQAVVAAQRVEIVGASVALEVVSRAMGVDVVQVEQSQRAGVFE